MSLRINILTLLAFVSFSSLAFVAESHADRPNECVRKVVRERNSCVSTCQSEFKIARDQCGINLSCRKLCKGAREDCEAPILQQRELCLDACEPALEQAKDQCRVQCNCSGDSCRRNACFIQCRRPALEAAFSCKQDCRDDFRLDPVAQAGLTACRAQAKQCTRTCRSSSSSSAATSQGGSSSANSESHSSENESGSHSSHH